MSEADQRSIIAQSGPISEWYVESRRITRADFITHLRPGDVAVVAWTANLAHTKGGKMDRVADLMDARGDIHAKGCILEEASTKRHSDKDWLAMKAAALPVLGRLAKGAKSATNGRKGSPPLPFTNAEIKTLLRIGESVRYKNWNQRRAAIKLEGIEPVPSRTWFNETLKHAARARGLVT